MSWVVEEWKEGLPTKTLQKIQELESQLEKLKKERQQKQLQLESLEAAFQKQKQKVESEKSEVTALKRENQSLIELCDGQEKARQKLSHEQQVKDTQVNILEGQLSASRKTVEKLEQELKRYKNDLERSQQSFNAADMSVCVTPQKSVTVSFTPVKLNDSKYEELQEKYNKEVEERKKLETELRILQIKLANQTSQPSAQNTMNHRDIARHQSSSSVFSWQQERTPSRSSSSSHDASLKRNYPSIQYPWEQEETPSKRGFRSDGGNRSFCEPSNNPANDQLRNQNQELRSRVNELELQFQVQEKEMKNQLNKLQETQTLLSKTQAEMAEKDKTLTKSRDDLARTAVQSEQSADKCAATEQKLKKVSEELSCQRQNAESARLALEQKLKEQERENQQELLRQQNALKNAEQELNQAKSKLSQESQQAKNEFNSVQSELERVTHGKKVLEAEVEDLKQKLSRAEQAVTAGQSHVTALKKDLEEARSQQNAIKSQLDHKTKENAKLEDEFRTANQTLRQNQVFIEELKNKNNSLEAEMKAAVQKLNNQDSASLQNLKATMTTLEKERDFAKELLQKRENDLTETKNTQAKMFEELSTLKTRLHCKEQECKDSIHRKNEYENNTIMFFKEKEEMSRRIKDSETNVQSLEDQITFLESDKKNLHTQIKTLQDIIDVRTADLEVQKVNCANANNQMVLESQKYQNEVENLLQKISELEAKLEAQEVNVWSHRVSLLENELEMQKNLSAELQGHLDLLLRNQQGVQTHASEFEEKHKCDSSLNDTVVDSFTSVVREKEEEIGRLSEQLSLVKAELESVYQNNKELKTKLQELTLLAESSPVERETLAASISCLQKDVEKLTEENKRLKELCNVLNDEKAQLSNAKIDTSEKSNAKGHNPVDGSREENTSRDESFQEAAEWREKVSRIQQENDHLLRANEELSSLIGKLRDNEFSLNRTLEELRVGLKDKETSLRSAQAKIELLNESGKEKALSKERAQEHLIDLQSPPSNALDRSNGSPLMETSQDSLKSSKEKSAVLHSLEETTLIVDGALMDNSLSDLTEDIISFAPSVGPQSREENLTLLINMDQLTLASGNDPTLALPDLTQLDSPNSTTLSHLTSPVQEKVDGNRKSITSEIVDLLLQQSPSQQQQVLSPGLESNQSAEIKDLLMIYHVEMSKLQKQHLSEIAVWQQKLKDQASEMETKLAAEKAETERLTQELEATKLELQVFDLSARSLLSFDNDDLSTRLDGANQTICTVLPIESLSLDNNEMQTSGHLKLSPKVEKISEMVNYGSPTVHEESLARCYHERKRRKSRSGHYVDKLETQDVSERLQLMDEEKQKLSQLVKDREEIKQNLVAEINDLSAQIAKLKTELLKKDQENQDLDNKSKDFEVKRLELLGIIDSISSEKLQLASKIVELEEQLNDSLNAVEMVKQQMAELSSIREEQDLVDKSKDFEVERLELLGKLDLISREKLQSAHKIVELEKELNDSLNVMETLKQQMTELSCAREKQNLDESKDFEVERLELLGRIDLISSEKLQSANKIVELEKELNDSLNVVETLKQQITELSSIQEIEDLDDKSKDFEIERLELLGRIDLISSEKLQLANKIVELEEELNDSLNAVEMVKQQMAELSSIREEQALLDESKDFEVERLELLGKIDLILSEKLQSANKIVELEKELNDSLNAMETLKQQMNELSSIRESLEISSKQWKENYLQTESELRRAKSEKANIENHALSLEADLDALQSKCHRLQEESEGNLRSFNETRENLHALVAEKCQLNQELESLAGEREELEQMYKRLTIREQELESSKLSLKELIKILEAELRTVKEELQAAKLTAEQLTTARDSMVGLQENEEKQVQELQSEIQRIQDEMKLLVNDQEDLQIQARTMQAENEKLSRDLERCQSEKRELGNSLNSAQEEVTLMRTGIEKLKIKIEADEKKKRHSMEKLKENERNFDKLNDKIESLEREMLMSEENFENAILQTETAKEEAERLKEQKEALEVELKCLRKKLEELQEELKSNQEKMVELETIIAALTKTLENREIEYTQFMDNSKKQDLLQVELDELLAQKALSDQKYETAMAKCGDMSSEMKQQKEQLMQELDKAQLASNDLELTLQQLALEQESCKLQLAEKTQQLLAIESQTKDTAQWEIKYSAEVSRFEVERENLKNQNKSLEAALKELEEKLWTLSSENETRQSTIAALETSCSDLEAQMEATKAEKQSLLNKVAELEGSCCGLQSKLKDTDLHLKSIQEENCRERRALDEAMKRQREDCSAQLLTSTSEVAELKTSVASLQMELESQAKKHRGDVVEYEDRLLQADSRHQSLLDEIRKQQDGALASYQEQITSLETHLNAHKQEIDCLKAGNGELNESLCKAQEQLAELKQLKVRFEDLKKENAETCRDLRQWVTSCKELEEEKEQLQRRLSRQEETLKGLAQKPDATDTNTSDNDLLSEMEELKQLLEEKTLEADESVEKYCNLMIKTHKLEDANDTLRKQVDVLSSRLKESKKEVVESKTLQSEQAANEVKKRRKSRRSTQGKQTGKRRRESENTEQNPSTPQAVSKRVKKTGSQGVEEEFEPEGLPELVKKGFADIPSEKKSPFVLQRTEVSVRRSPRLSSQTNSPSVLNTRIDRLENLLHLNSPTPGGSKPHLAKATEEDSAPMDLLSPLSSYVKVRSRASDNLGAGKPEKERANVQASHDETEEEGTCQVQ